MTQDTRLTFHLTRAETRLVIAGLRNIQRDLADTSHWQLEDFVDEFHQLHDHVQDEILAIDLENLMGKFNIAL